MKTPTNPGTAADVGLPSGALLATPRTDAHLRGTQGMFRAAAAANGFADFARELERENNRYAETLHDGFAVYCALTDDAKRYTSPECVSAVLDAFKRAMANVEGETRRPSAPHSP